MRAYENRTTGGTRNVSMLVDDGDRHLRDSEPGFTVLVPHGEVATCGGALPDVALPLCCPAED